MICYFPNLASNVFIIGLFLGLRHLIFWHKKICINFPNHEKGNATRPIRWSSFFLMANHSLFMDAVCKTCPVVIGGNFRCLEVSFIYISTVLEAIANSYWMHISLEAWSPLTELYHPLCLDMNILKHVRCPYDLVRVLLQSPFNCSLLCSRRLGHLFCESIEYCAKFWSKSQMPIWILRTLWLARD